MKYCKINFSISENYIDEVALGTFRTTWCVFLSVWNPHIYMRDFLFMRENQSLLIKDGKLSITNVQKGKYKISMASAYQAKELIHLCRKFVSFSWDRIKKTLNR